MQPQTTRSCGIECPPTTEPLTTKNPKTAGARTRECNLTEVWHHTKSNRLFLSLACQHSSARIKVTAMMMSAAGKCTWAMAIRISSAFLFSSRATVVIRKRTLLALVLKDLNATHLQLTDTDADTHAVSAKRVPITKRVPSTTTTTWHTSNLKTETNVHGSTRNQS